MFADEDFTPIQEITTPAGHKFWYHSMPDADRTALAVSWAQEVPFKSFHPAAAILGVDVMLNGGAGGRDAAEIVADYQDLDAGSDLWVEPRAVMGFIVASDVNFSKAREIAQDVITAPKLEQRWFDRQQQQLLEEWREDASGSWTIGWNVARSVVAGDHPYNRLWSQGPLDEIEKISLDNINQWFESSFSTNTASVAVAGSVDPELVAKELDLLFADMPAHEASDPVEFPTPAVPGLTVLFHNPDAPKTVVMLIGNLPPEDPATDQQLQLSIGVLGQSPQSRLHKAVRAGLGASYGFGAGKLDIIHEHRLLVMSGEIETAKVAEALKEVEEAYVEFRESGIGRIEFPLAKRMYKRQVNSQLENPVNMAFNVIDAMKRGYSKDILARTLDSINSMKRDDANDIISNSLPAYGEFLKVIVSPDSKAVEGACVISKIEDARSCLK